MFKKILNYFDKLEDRVRGSLSHHPIPYSIIGALAIIVFWDGVSQIMSEIELLQGFWGGVILVSVSIVVALLTGVFVSFFVGDTIIISGLKGEKKLIDKTESEIEAEEGEVRKLGIEIRDELSDLKKVEAKLDMIEGKVDKIELELK
ncbi:MAG: hypothetical protein HZA95_00525 [Candidatus Vogelbacteria bacterium]|nr:hypothetical protein [Candidatus Vogelbacteria bacterium]